MFEKTPLVMLAAVFVTVAGFLSPAAAITIVEVPNTDDYGISLNFGTTAPIHAAGTAFTLCADYTDVTISAPILCISCTGEVILHEGGLGASADLSGLVASSVLAAGVNSLLFSGLSLTSGEYYLLTRITQGTGGWSGDAAGTVNTDGVSADGPDVQAAGASETYLPESIFTIVAAPGRLALNITGTRPGDVVPAVPLPASSVLLLGALGAFWRRRDVRRNMSRLPAPQ